MTISRAIIASFILLAATFAGCGGGSALNPQFQPQVTNQADNFQFQTTGITNITQTLTYTWQNSGTLANINQACAITGGTASLTVKDASGNQVYSASLTANGTYMTSPAGTAGAWTITITLNKATGTLNFRAQKV